MAESAVSHAYGYLTQPEIRFLDAALERLIPADELGPGAKEADVSYYINRQLCSVCARTAGSTLTAEALIAFVGERIARYKKPQYVEFIYNMPALENGKPDRVAVKAKYGGN